MKTMFQSWCGRTNGHHSMERCNPKNTIIFHMESSQQNIQNASKRWPHFIYNAHTHISCVLFFVLLSVISKASIDEIIATIDCCSYECIYGIFIQILFFFFYFDAKVRVLHANQVDSTCLRLVFSVSALLLFFICVTIRLWANNIEERYTPMMIMKSSQFFPSYFVLLLWHGISIVSSFKN